jgi:iron complex transport system substrate-binding protein
LPIDKQSNAIRATVVIALAVAIAPAAAQTLDKPARIVSLNMCTDDLLLRLADPARIASVTWLSRGRSGSNVADIAARVPVNHGLAEEIIPLDPDLVIAGTFSTRTAVGLLKRTRIPLVEFAIPRSIEEVRGLIRAMARLVGESEQGEHVIRRMDERLAAIPPLTGARPRAIVLNPNGATVGRGTLVDEIMTRAGLDNVAATLGIDSYGLLTLETIVSNAIDVLIVSSARDDPPALATEILKHPVIERLSDRVRIVSMPARLWNCGTPAVTEAVELLRREVDAFNRGRATQ